MKTVQIEGGISLTEEQVIQAYGKLKEPEFSYPMWFEHIYSPLVVRFDALQNANCVIAGDGWKRGEVSTTCKPHTNEKIWQQVAEPKLYELSEADCQRVIDEGFYVRETPTCMFKPDNICSLNGCEIVREKGLRQPHFVGDKHPEGNELVVAYYDNDKWSMVLMAHGVDWDIVKEYIVL